jgi:transcriptional regulator with XRE-family HTH domain
MTPEQFKEWRKAAGFRSRESAAEALGISASTVALYETGVRRDNGHPVDIPLLVEMACAAFDAGLTSKGRDRMVREAHLSKHFDSLEHCLTPADRAVLARKILIDFSDVLRDFERQYLERCAQPLADKIENSSRPPRRDS